MNTETGAVLALVRTVDGVSDIQHAHFWQMDEHRTALDDPTATRLFGLTSIRADLHRGLCPIYVR